MSKQKPNRTDSRNILKRLSWMHFWYVAAYALTLVIFDAWNLLAPEDNVRRWYLVAALFVVFVSVWYLARRKLHSSKIHTPLIIVLLTADIIFAAVNVYWQRGMASKAVMLFAVPIVAAGLSRSRKLLLATTLLSTAAYAVAAIKYFFDFYGEGYRVELYGEIFFYSAIFFVLAGLMVINSRSTKD